MSDAPKKTISMTAIAYHEHYDVAGLRQAHEPGDVYDLADSGGMTAEELANVFVGQRLALRTADLVGKKKPSDKKK